MNVSPGNYLSVQQRVEELLVAAMAMYSNSPTTPESSEYQEVLGICRERAMKAFEWHLKRCKSAEAVFEELAPCPIPGTSYISTHPLQDLVHCELVMRGHAPAVELFIERSRALAEKTMRKIDPMHRSAGKPGNSGRSKSDRDYSQPDTAMELVIQALLHDFREEYRKGTEKKPAGKHAGELDGLPLRGLPLRKFEAQRPLFCWLSRILPRLLRKLQTIRCISSTEELGTGTIAAGAQKVLLHTGYFHETRHIRALVRISGAGKNGKPLGTRLLDVLSRSTGITEKPAQTTVSVPKSVRLVHRARRELQPAESWDYEDSSGNSDPAIAERCNAVLEKLMHLAVTRSGLKAHDIELLRKVFSKPQKELAKDFGIDPGNITRRREKIIKKLQHQFEAISRSATDDETQACLELVYKNSQCQTFAALLMRVLEYWPLMPPSSPTQPSLHGTWKLVMRNVPEESQPSQSGAGIERLISGILRNPEDEQGSIEAED